MRLCKILCAGLFVLSLAACSNELKVQDVNPPHGTFSGGEEVTIEGNGFQPGRSGVVVRFGKREATTAVIESSSKIKVTTPAGDPNSNVDVTVTFDDGKSFQVKNGFHYMAQNNQKATMDKAFDQMGHNKK